MTHPLRHYLVAVVLSLLANFALFHLILWVNAITHPPESPPPSSRQREFRIDRAVHPERALRRPTPVPVARAPGLALPKLALPSAILLDAPRLDALALDPGTLLHSPDFNGEELVFKEDAVDTPSRVVSRVMPRYPRLARQQRIEGHVLFRIVIGPDGSVESTRLIDSQPAGIFDSVASTAIARFRYSPARVDGQPVRSYKRQKIHFTLRK